MPDSPDSSERHGNELSRQILPSSGTMIAICTMLVGLVKVVEDRIGERRADEGGAAVAGIFFCSAMLSYLAIRYAHHATASRRMERLADVFFITGLVGLLCLTVLFAYDIL